jgi:hypothetical protein
MGGDRLRIKIITGGDRLQEVSLLKRLLRPFISIGLNCHLEMERGYG